MAASYAGGVTILLRLLDEVSYDGSPVTGSRPADLLAALVLHPTGVSDLRLVDEVWRDDPPAIPGKALQVLVSRLRTQLRRRGGGACRRRLPAGARARRRRRAGSWSAW